MGSVLEGILAAQITAAGLPEPKREHKFHPKRKWKFDFAWPAHMVAVEAEGGVWTRGRHVRGQGFIDDCEKYNRATLMGWRVLRYPSVHIKSGQAIEEIKEALSC